MISEQERRAISLWLRRRAVDAFILAVVLSMGAVVIISLAGLP